MNKRISDIFDYGDEMVIVTEQDDVFDPARIKELTMRKINKDDEDAIIQKTMKKVWPAYRTVIIAAVIAVLMIGSALAVSYSSWSAGLQNLLNLSEEQTVSLEASELISYPEVSDSHEGVTVSVEQAVADGKSACLALRVEGPEVSDITDLVYGEVLVTINGERASGWSVRVYDDLHWDGEQYVYSDGTPASLSEGRIVREDGSVEIDIALNGLGMTDSLIGKEITVTIDSLVLEQGTKKTAIEGPWVLTWTAEGSDVSRTWEFSEELSYGITLKSVMLSPLAVRVEYEYPPLTIADDRAYAPDGLEILGEEPVFLYQILMKDGTVYTGVLGGGVSGPDADDDGNLENGFTYVVDSSLSCVLDPDEVEALVFREAGTGNGQDGGIDVFYTVSLPD